MFTEFNSEKNAFIGNRQEIGAPLTMIQLRKKFTKIYLLVFLDFGVCRRRERFKCSCFYQLVLHGCAFSEIFFSLLIFGWLLSLSSNLVYYLTKTKIKPEFKMRRKKKQQMCVYVSKL